MTMRTLFGATLLIAAALIFWAELLCARLLLPLLGGGASVWNTSLVFFQVALLGGYLYAHASVRWLPGRWGVFLHPALLLAAALALPISAARLAPPAGGANPIGWQLAALALMVGAPFVVLSGTASLLQAWFARLDEKAARDPYFLYAASNLGSLAALATYPTLAEPNLSLLQQSGLWSAGYLVVTGLALACAAATALVGRA
ncbi:MAG TPA: spermidine synthase, partial [Caulobacteraceae bacterium]|nr:spermidine synthase [Caulobacteraceae bacterium]